MAVIVGDYWDYSYTQEGIYTVFGPTFWSALRLIKSFVSPKRATKLILENKSYYISKKIDTKDLFGIIIWKSRVTHSS